MLKLVIKARLIPACIECMLCPCIEASNQARMDTMRKKYLVPEHLLIMMLSPGASVCSACSASSCAAGQYLSGCGGASAGTCAWCTAGSYSVSSGELLAEQKAADSV